MQEIILNNNEFINDLKQYGKKVNFNKDYNPVSYENSDKYFYIILSGKIKIFNLNIQTSREQTLYMLSKGDVFDPLVLLDGLPHEVMSEVLEEGEAIELPIYIVREWLNSNPQFKSFFLPYISRQLRNVEELATDLSLLSTSERLTKLILKDIESSGELLRGLSHTEMGNLIGTVRHVIERHLKENKIIKKDDILKKRGVKKWM